jgi:hypothetical protein
MLPLAGGNFRPNLPENWLGGPSAAEGTSAPSMPDPQTNIEFRIAPLDGHWFWEVIRLTDHKVIARGMAQTEPEAHEQATRAARKAKLI